jgi:hypothetical protein
MPIGKNAIKRVVSSGYSAPKTTDDTKKVEEIKEAPVAVEEKATKSAPKKSAPKKTTTPKTSSAKPKQPSKSPKKSEAAEEMVAVVKETKIEVVKSEDSARECQYFSIGEDLPIYLL